MTIGLYCNWKVIIAGRGFYISKIHAKYLMEFKCQYNDVILLSNTSNKELTDEFVYIDYNDVNVIALPSFKKYSDAFRFFFKIIDGIKKLSKVSNLIYVRTPEPFAWSFLFFTKGKVVNYHFASNPIDVIKKSNSTSLLSRMLRVSVFYPEYLFICISASIKSVTCNGPSVLKFIPFFLRGKAKVLIESTLNDDVLQKKTYQSKVLGDVFKLLSVTRLQHAKGLPELIDSIVLYKKNFPTSKISLTIVGDGPLREQLEKKVADLKAPHYINFKGTIENGPCLDRIYQEHDVLINASHSETGPRVVLEAMAESTVCISTDVGYVRYIVGEYGILNDLILNDDFSNDLHIKINALRNDPELFKKCSELSFNIAKKYSLTRFVRGLFK